MSRGRLPVTEQVIAAAWLMQREAMTMIVLDIFAAALVIIMLGAMLDEDTRDSRIKIAR